MSSRSLFPKNHCADVQHLIVPFSFCRFFFFLFFDFLDFAVHGSGQIESIFFLSLTGFGQYSAYPFVAFWWTVPENLEHCCSDPVRSSGSENPSPWVLVDQWM